MRCFSPRRTSSAEDDVQIEEAAVVGDHQNALPLLEHRQALEAVHVPQVLGAVVNPALSDRALAEAKKPIQKSRLEGALH